MTFPIAEVAPAVPAAGALVSLFFSVLLFAVASAVVVLWVQILRKPLVRLANVSVARFHPFGFLNTVVNNVDHWLDSAQKGSERAVTWSLHALMWSFSTGYKLTLDLAHAVYDFRNRMVHLTTRHVGANTGQSISPRIKRLEREYKGIEAELKQLERREHAKRATGAAAGAQDLSLLRRGIDRLNTRLGQITRELHGIEHGQTHAGAKAKTGTQAIPRSVPRVVPRTRAPAHHWTDVFTRAAAATLVVAALARLGLSWLRCPALGRIGKRLGCGGFNWLEGFLATTFEAMVVLDLCQFALAAQRLARIIVPQLAGTLLVQNAVCLGGGASFPSAHDSPKTLTRVTLPSAHD